MVEPGRNLLGSLPTALVCEVFCGWLDIAHIVRVDTATCERKARARLMALFRSDEFCLDRKYFRIELEWILLREIKIRKLEADKSIKPDIAAIYLSEFGSRLTSLTLIDGIQSKVVQSIAIHCRHLRSLTVAMDHPGSEVFDLLRNNLHLEHLRFSSFETIKSSDFNGIVLPNVHSLSINSRESTEEVVLSMLRMCPNVKALVAPFGHLLPPELNVHVTIAQHCPHLTALCLKYCKINDTSLQAIASHCLHLTYMDISINPNITDNGIVALATTLKLQNLAFDYNALITDRSIDALMRYCSATLRRLCIFARLGSFDPESCGVSVVCVQTLRQRCPQLTYEWDTKIISPIRHISVCRLSTHLGFVLALETDEFLYRAALHCPLLQYLNLTRDIWNQPPSYTEAGLRSVITHCANLRKIVIRHPTILLFACLVREHPKLFTAEIHEAEVKYDILKNDTYC